MTSRAYNVAAAVLAFLPACTRTDGHLSADDGWAGSACAVDLDCGGGRHCGSEKRCTLECTSAKDCAFMLDDPSAPNEMECSACGRCLPRGSEDTSCRLITDAPCTDSADCVRTAGRDQVCGDRGVCAPKCRDDDDCTHRGKGWACGGGVTPSQQSSTMSAGGGGVTPSQQSSAVSAGDSGGWCVRSCFRETDCVYHGWHFTCDVPPGVNLVSNADAPLPVFGECVPREGGIDWEGGADFSRPSGAYRGVWGVMFNTAVRVTGLPIVTMQDTVWNQLALAKVTQDGDGIVMHQKLCAVDQRNFNENDSTPYDFEHMLIPDAFVESMPIFVVPARAVPQAAEGAEFRSEIMLNVRGARLPDPAADPLPTREDLSNAWDQDRDRNPGITTVISGVLSGDVYVAQRWWVAYRVEVVDADHMHGLLDHGFENSTLGASKPELLYDLKTLAHPQTDRSYFRAVRLADTASCDDVTRLAKSGPGTWLKFKPHYDPGERP